MLSYVIPAPQETSAANGRSSNRTEGDAENGGGSITNREPVPSPPRSSLSLRLNSQYMAGTESHTTEVDALLANVNVASGHEFCDDERTHLLNDTNHTSSPVRVKRQNSNGSNNNNSFSLNNNANNTSSNTDVTTNNRRCSGDGGGGGDGGGVNVAGNNCGDDVVNVNVCSSVEGTSSDDGPDSHHTTVTHTTEKPPAQQDESQNPRQQSMTTKKPKLSKLGSNKTVGLKR